MKLADFSLKKSKVQTFITQLNWVLANGNVGPVDRTAATEVILAEIFASAAPLPEEGQSTSAFFRSNVLPALQNILSSVVEVCTLNVDQVIKLTFNVYQYRLSLVYPKVAGVIRPNINRYIEELDVRHQQIVKEYPDLDIGYWALVDVFTAVTK